MTEIDIYITKKDAPIGVFDSGVGGLTVVRRIRERLPAENVVYLGDTARVPYGTKSAETVVRYARQCARVLMKNEIKFLVVACNTASAYALKELSDELDIPVTGVVEPGANVAAASTRNGRIGVIGTAGTIASGVYPSALHRLSPDLEVSCKACPLFVPLAEEGWTTGPIARQVAATYLKDLAQAGVDTLILGCTHYPLLTDVIADEVGPDVELVDSAGATAEAVQDAMETLGLVRARTGKGRYTFMVSDGPEQFADVGRRFLGDAIETVDWIDFL